MIVFSNDAHEQGDPELAIWGEHALAGTPGAQGIRELEPHLGEREFLCPKRAYGAFDGTDLDERLRSVGVDVVVCRRGCRVLELSRKPCSQAV